jgi:GNAT superfamily N-acetyltransferase
MLLRAIPPGWEINMFAPQDDADVVQSFIDFGLEWLEDHKYSLTVDVDMKRWAKAMASAPAIAGVNTTFDPRCCRLTPDNSFWLDIRAGSHSIAMMAMRLFITDDYLELKRSMRLWYDQPEPGDAPLRLTVATDLPIIRGNVGHEGGLWVHPEHRKRGLSAILPHLIRALAVRQWNLDWQTGLAMRDIGASGIVRRTYGMPHVVPCYEGFFRVVARQERLYLAYMSREELVAGLDLDRAAALLPDRHAQPNHPVALVKEG